MAPLLSAVSRHMSRCVQTKLSELVVTPSAVPISSYIAPDACPVVFAAYNQVIGQGGTQGQSALQSLLAASHVPV